MQDVASWMWKPPRAATCCPSKDMAGILHKLENLTGIGFCCLCYTLGDSCRCSKAAPQAPLIYRDLALWVPPQPSYASMTSSMITTASTSMRGVSSTAGPPPGFPVRGMPSPMDVSLASQSYNLLTQASVGRGCRLQPTPDSARPQSPGTISLCQERPSAIHPQISSPGSHEATQATPYRQAIHLPQQDTRVRFAPPVTETKTATNTNQSQSVATRGRPQFREHESHQGLASRSRRGPRDRSSTRGPRDRSSTRGPKKLQRGITSEDPMDDLMEFMPSGWRRNLIHIVGCFYTSQIAPLDSREWDNDWDEFMGVMDDHKDREWLDIKELTPLQYMPYVARCFHGQMLPRDHWPPSERA